MKLYTIMDLKVKEARNVFAAKNNQAVLRFWEDKVNQADQPEYKHPEDFALFELADYDEETATITNPKYHLLSTAKEVYRGSNV